MGNNSTFGITINLTIFIRADYPIDLLMCWPDDAIWIQYTNMQSPGPKNHVDPRMN